MNIYCSGGSKEAPSVRATFLPPPRPDQYFLNFMQLVGNFGKSYMSAPEAGGLVPPLTDILDPPLYC